METRMEKYLTGTGKNLGFRLSDCFILPPCFKKDFLVHNRVEFKYHLVTTEGQINSEDFRVFCSTYLSSFSLEFLIYNAS